FTVSLSPPSSQPVTVAYATADSTAKAGTDYTAAAGTLSFAAGETVKTVNVPEAANTVSQPNRSFSLNLKTPTGATFADSTATASIIDDDHASALAVGDPSTLECASTTLSRSFTVSLSPPSSQPVTVAYATADSTAKAPTDYTA